MSILKWQDEKKGKREKTNDEWWHDKWNLLSWKLLHSLKAFCGYFVSQEGDNLNVNNDIVSSFLGMLARWLLWQLSFEWRPLWMEDLKI